jgi:hypothetical protein
MEAALQLPSRPDPHEFRINLLFAAAGLVSVAWALLSHGYYPLIGLCTLAVPLTAWARAGTAAHSHLSHPDFRSAMRTIWLAVPLAGLFAWSRYVELPPAQFLGLAIFVVGAILFSSAVGQKQMNSIAGWSAALMAGGLLLPIGLAPVVAVFAGTLGLGGFLSAVLAFMTREGRAHGAS